MSNSAELVSTVLISICLTLVVAMRTDVQRNGEVIGFWRYWVLANGFAFASVILYWLMLDTLPALFRMIEFVLFSLGVVLLFSTSRQVTALRRSHFRLRLYILMWLCMLVFAVAVYITNRFQGLGLACEFLLVALLMRHHVQGGRIWEGKILTKVNLALLWFAVAGIVIAVYGEFLAESSKASDFDVANRYASLLFWLILNIYIAVLQLVGTHRRWEFLAKFDDLTEVPNRGAFLVSASELIQFIAKRPTGKKSFFVMFADLDHFKRVNDAYGHQVGDQVLKDFVKQLKQKIRTDTLIGRLGGEEFVLIGEIPAREDVVSLAERLTKTISERKLELANGKTLNYTMSLGVVYAEHYDGGLSYLLRLADQTMYKAKQRRNSYEIEDSPSSPDESMISNTYSNSLTFAPTAN